MWDYRCHYALKAASAEGRKGDLSLADVFGRAGMKSFALLLHTPLLLLLLLSSGALTEVSLILTGSCCHGCVSALWATCDGISMDTDRDDTGLWGVGGRQYTGVSSSVCWRQTEGDRGGGGRGGLGSGKILNREEQELEKEWTEEWEADVEG